MNRFHLICRVRSAIACAVQWGTQQVTHKVRHAWSNRLLWGVSCCGLMALFTLIWEIGWPLNQAMLGKIQLFTWGIVVVAAIAELGLTLLEKDRTYLLRAIFLLALPVVAVAQLLFGETVMSVLGVIVPKQTVPTLALGVVQFTLILPSTVRIIRWMRDQSWFSRIPPGLLGVISFALAITAGAAFLMTPNATYQPIHWIDAFFTSTSAVCVTGLSTLNVETQFTFTGQAIILVLIQIGGLGVMTLTYFLALIAGQGIGLRDRVALRDLLSEDNLGRVSSFVWHIILATFLIELAGILLLHHFWAPTHADPSRLWWDCVFHGISAFCNAGFSTYGDGMMNASVINNHGVHVVIMLLIIAGGFGFALFTELLRYFYARLSNVWIKQQRLLPRLSVHCRLAALMTIILLVGGTFGFVISGNSWWEALFNSVSTRTAGFNISNFGAHGSSALVVACILMAIGGNPGGTAGGVKTTTFALSMLEVRRILRGLKDLRLWDRRASRDAVEKSLVTVVLSIAWISAASFLVGMFNTAASHGDIVFECVSAFGTVGLTRGLTPILAEPSKAVIILTMFAGRIGILAFVLSLAGPPKPSNYRLPETRVPLG